MNFWNERMICDVIKDIESMDFWAKMMESSSVGRDLIKKVRHEEYEHLLKNNIEYIKSLNDMLQIGNVYIIQNENTACQRKKHTDKIFDNFKVLVEIHDDLKFVIFADRNSCFA